MTERPSHHTAEDHHKELSPTPTQQPSNDDVYPANPNGEDPKTWIAFSSQHLSTSLFPVVHKWEEEVLLAHYCPKRKANSKTLRELHLCKFISTLPQEPIHTPNNLISSCVNHVTKEPKEKGLSQYTSQLTAKEEHANILKLHQHRSKTHLNPSTRWMTMLMVWWLTSCKAKEQMKKSKHRKHFVNMKRPQTAWWKESRIDGMLWSQGKEQAENVAEVAWYSDWRFAKKRTDEEEISLWKWKAAVRDGRHADESKTESDRSWDRKEKSRRRMQRIVVERNL